MRTTLTIDDDVLAAARHQAERDQKSIGEVISSLARRGLSPGDQPPLTHRNGIPVLPRAAGAMPVTLALVNQLRDEP